MIDRTNLLQILDITIMILAKIRIQISLQRPKLTSATFRLVEPFHWRNPSTSNTENTNENLPLLYNSPVDDVLVVVWWRPQTVDWLQRWTCEMTYHANRARHCSYAGNNNHRKHKQKDILPTSQSLL